MRRADVSAPKSGRRAWTFSLCSLPPRSSTGTRSGRHDHHGRAASEVLYPRNPIVNAYGRRITARILSQKPVTPGPNKPKVAAAALAVVLVVAAGVWFLTSGGGSPHTAAKAIGVTGTSTTTTVVGTTTEETTAPPETVPPDTAPPPTAPPVTPVPTTSRRPTTTAPSNVTISGSLELSAFIPLTLETPEMGGVTTCARQSSNYRIQVNGLNGPGIASIGNVTMFSDTSDALFHSLRCSATYTVDVPRSPSYVLSLVTASSGTVIKSATAKDAGGAVKAGPPITARFSCESRPCTTT